MSRQKEAVTEDEELEMTKMKQTISQIEVKAAICCSNYCSKLQDQYRGGRPVNIHELYLLKNRVLMLKTKLKDAIKKKKRKRRSRRTSWKAT